MKHVRSSKFACPPRQRDRREFRLWPMALFVVAFILCLIEAPLPSDAQQPGKVYRIGVLTTTGNDTDPNIAQ